MTPDYDIEYRNLDSEQTYLAQCTSLTGSAISFVSERDVLEGKAMEIRLHTKNPAKPLLTAYIETVKVGKTPEQLYEIKAAIKILKGN